jgi:hypothetical protein
MDVLLRDIGETLNAKTISFPGGEEIYTTASLSASIPTLPALQTGAEEEDELSNLMKDLHLPPTPSEIDGISPTQLEPEIRTGKDDGKSFIPIQLMTKSEDIKTAKIPRHQHLSFVKAARMENWNSAVTMNEEEVDGSDVDLERVDRDRLDRVDRVEKAVHTV